MFLNVSMILFTGGSAPLHDGIHPPSRHPPPQDQRQADPPWDQVPPSTQCMLGDTGNKRAVCILLECNLVSENANAHVDAENGCRIHSLHLCFVTIASIISENANADLNLTPSKDEE